MKKISPKKSSPHWASQELADFPHSEPEDQSVSTDSRVEEILVNDVNIIDDY